MTITHERKNEIINKFASFPGNTGSVEVQCALLTERIIRLTEYCKVNKKDFSCKRGLLILVGKRRSLLGYIKRKNISRYNNIIQQLEIRR